MEDRDAIQRCRHGEIDAFRHLVHRYQRRALAHARALTGSDADAADMVQSAFLDAFRELERFDQTWGERYPMIAQAWRRDWEHITPFLALPEDLRRVVYTTNTIEAMHRQIRKAIKTRGHFPDEQAATKLIYLAIERAETKWRSVRAWTSGLAALKIHFGDRLPD